MKLSKEQLALQQACKEYEKRFGQPYGIAVGQYKSLKEVLDEINWCLENNSLQPDPDYSSDVIY